MLCTAERYPCFGFSLVFSNAVFPFSVPFLEGVRFSWERHYQTRRKSMFPVLHQSISFFCTIVSSIICWVFHTRFPLHSTHPFRVSSTYGPKIPFNILSVPIFTFVLRNNQVIGSCIVILNIVERIKLRYNRVFLVLLKIAPIAP